MTCSKRWALLSQKTAWLAYGALLALLEPFHPLSETASQQFIIMHSSS